MPRQELIEARDRMLGDAAQDVGEPCLRVDPIELGGADQGVDRRRALATTIGTGEQP